MYRIIQEIKKRKICDIYWNEEIESQLKSPIKLKYAPNEYISYYKAEYSFNLIYLGNDDKLNNTTAKLNLIFTSNEEHFDFEEAMQDSLGNNHSINAVVAVYLNSKEIFTSRFRLFSKDEDQVSGLIGRINLFI